jgi:hypothetical protein
VWAARSAVAALAILSLTGCSDSHVVNSSDVTKALLGERFSAHRVVGKEAEGVSEVFTDAPRGVKEVVTAYRPDECACAPVSLQPYLDLADLTLAAFVFDSEQNASASCRQANVLGVCLQRRNVVLVVRGDRAPAARKALAALD